MVMKIGLQGIIPSTNQRRRRAKSSSSMKANINENTTTFAIRNSQPEKAEQ